MGFELLPIDCVLRPPISDPSTEISSVSSKGLLYAQTHIDLVHIYVYTLTTLNGHTPSQLM